MIVEFQIVETHFWELSSKLRLFVLEADWKEEIFRPVPTILVFFCEKFLMKRMTKETANENIKAQRNAGEYLHNNVFLNEIITF